MTSSSSDSEQIYEKPVILKDGSTLRLRPIQPRDEERMLSLFSRLSGHAVYLRFHHVLAQMSREEARRFCTVDYENNFALVATIGEDAAERIVAVGRYSRLPKGDRAEMAFVVEDKYQGKGIATHLLEELAEVARGHGIRTFEAEVPVDNRDMMKVFRDSGLTMSQRIQHGVSIVSVDIAPTEVAEVKAAEREQVAIVASLRPFLEPKSIAVIGASRRDGSIGNKIFRSILYQGFTGVLYPVNPNTDVVASVKAYPSVLDIPGDVDLAVIVIPAAMVPEAVEQCGRKGVKGIVVISAGFGEAGPEGIARQEAIVRTASDYGMRIIGPNCMGVINTDPQFNMNATFSSVFPPIGRTAFCTQSGALGLAILEYAHNLNIGLSKFVSIGNRADVSSNDLLEYFEQDPATDVILLYLESFGGPRKFARTARRVTPTKPVVAVKSGRTSAGSRAAASHTGALATTDVASEALFRQVGMIRVDKLEELFDVANLLTHQPVPFGRRVAILTNGGGPGIMTADACASQGLELPTLPKETTALLRGLLPAGASLVNPIDMTAEATAEQYGKSLELLLQADNIDTVIVIFIPPIVTQAEAVAGAIRAVAPKFRRSGKTLVASFMGSRGATAHLGSKEEGYVPAFAFPEDTASALADVCSYRDWLNRPVGRIPEYTDIDGQKAKDIIASALERSGAETFWLDAASVLELLQAYGIHVAESKVANTPDKAAKAAKAMGFPVVVKLVSATIAHKTEVGGVVLGLTSESEVKKVFKQIANRLASIGREDEMQGVLVQQMITEGIETIVGVTQDPSFGPLMLFGLGGIHSELFKDVTIRIHPLTDVDAREMVRSVKSYQLLEGWRGSKPSDIKAVEELLLRVSAMVEDLPEIAEMDLNPVKVMKQGAGYLVVDARVLIKRPS